MCSTILSLDHIGLKSSGDCILKGISFNIEKGEKIVISGPSGSGKSTLLKIIGSILSPTEGRILYKNQSIEAIEPTKYRKEVSYFFQNASLFDQTVRDNLSFPYLIRGETFSEEKARGYLEQVKLQSTDLDKPIKELSGGEIQRVALIRNLLFEPELLLLDEITSALDQKNSEIILALIERLNREKGKTILMVTHDQKQIAKADRLICLMDGRLEEAI